MSSNAQAVLQDAAERERIRTDLHMNLLVEAGAGSGKTESLAQRMVSLVAEGRATTDQIAAVTFTRKAAAELHGRFRLELERRIASTSEEDKKNRLLTALDEAEHLFAGTIHSFCARLLRERPVEAGLAPSFREIEEAEDTLLRRAAWREYTDAERGAGSPDLAMLARAEVRLADLTDAFGKICQYPDVVFPPGDATEPDATTGWQALDAFWKELQQLCGTIKEESKCQVQKRIREFETPYRNADRNRPASLARLMSHWKPSTKLTKKWWLANHSSAEHLLERFRAGSVEPFLDQWWAFVYRHATSVMIRARDHVAQVRRRSALLNFTDLLLLAAKLMREDLNVRAAMQHKYRFLFVDEFQDTDPLQLELLFLLAAAPGAGQDWSTVPLRPGALFLVGDPKQSIYRFRRADIDMYQRAKARILETGGDVLELTSCFRSGPSLCNWVNGVFVSSPPTPATMYQPEFAPLHPGVADGRQAQGPIVLDLTAIDRSEVQEYEAGTISKYIFREVNEGRRGYGDFLILTRKKRNRLGPYLRALEHAQIPYEVSGSGGLVESEYVQELITLLRCLTHPEDGAALVGVLRGLCFGFSDAELYDWKRSGGAFRLSVPFEGQVRESPVGRAVQALQQWRRLLQELPPGAAVDVILEQSGLLARASASSASGGEAGRLLFAQDCLRASCEAGLTLADAVSVLEEALDDDESDAPPLEAGRRDVVRLMNLHKAKGLEAEVVFLADPLGGASSRVDLHVTRGREGAIGFMELSRAFVNGGKDLIGRPRGWDQYRQEEENFCEAEERRLLYVAATRAKQTLVVSRYSASSPWSELNLHLAGGTALPNVDSVASAAIDLPDLSCERRDAARAVREDAWRRAAVASFETLAVSTMAVHDHSGGGRQMVNGTASGRVWGTLIHALLEYAVLNPDCPAVHLQRIAAVQQATAGVEAEDFSLAVATIEQVRRSELWEMVSTAEIRLAEVPVAMCVEGRPVSLRKGVIDLALRRSDGWYIIDYKTDHMSLEGLVETYSSQVCEYATVWTQITGERVVFAGLYSVPLLRLSQNLRGVAVGGQAGG